MCRVNLLSNLSHSLIRFPLSLLFRRCFVCVSDLAAASGDLTSGRDKTDILIPNCTGATWLRRRCGVNFSCNSGNHSPASAELVPVPLSLFPLRWVDDLPTLLDASV